MLPTFTARCVFRTSMAPRRSTTCCINVASIGSAACDVLVLTETVHDASWALAAPHPEKLWDSVTGSDFRSCLDHLQLQLHDILVHIFSIVAHTRCTQSFGGWCCAQLQRTEKVFTRCRKVLCELPNSWDSTNFPTPGDVCDQELWPFDLHTQHQMLTQSVRQLEGTQSENRQLPNEHWLSAFKDPLGHSKAFKMIRS